MNVIALPVDEGYATLGQLVERDEGFEAVQVDGKSLGLFNTADAAVAALVARALVDGPVSALRP
jgi:hypothetical protein